MLRRAGSPNPSPYGTPDKGERGNDGVACNSGLTRPAVKAPRRLWKRLPPFPRDKVQLTAETRDGLPASVCSGSAGLARVVPLTRPESGIINPL